MSSRVIKPGIIGYFLTTGIMGAYLKGKSSYNFQNRIVSTSSTKKITETSKGIFYGAITGPFIIPRCLYEKYR